MSLHRILVSLSLTLLLSFAPAGVIAQESISLFIPQALIEKAAKKAMPLEIKTAPSGVEGRIRVVNISNLRFAGNHLSCRLRLHGRNMAILSEIGGHQIRLNVGSLDLDFSTKAQLRFDPKKQILYIRPLVQNVYQSGNAGNAETGQALIALLNGQEFPVQLEKIEPFMAKTTGKTIMVNTKVLNIKTKTGGLQISLQPVITVR
ncbi:MAG: hypothetical protein CSA20_03010 [Deltaproteobacteria bacterium]|nr:MAG: hypothetical protein CSA20_03010 [Deltaproteobacteria bacterium]